MLYGGTYNILKSLRKDVRNTSATEADKSFTLPGHIFNTNTKFILIEQLVNTTNVPTETLKEYLKNRENIWIIKVKTQTPNGVSQ